MSPIFRSVALIEHYLNEEEGAEPPHPQSVREAFQNLERALEHIEESALSRRDVEKIVEVSNAYLQSCPDYHQRIQKIEAIFGKFKKGRIAEKLTRRAEHILVEDETKRSKQIDTFAKNIEHASNDDIKHFIFEMMQSSSHILRLSPDDILTLLNQKLNNSLDLATLFTAYELKTGKVRNEPLPTVEECVQRVKDQPQRVLRSDPIDERTISRLREERAFRLEHLECVYRRVIQDPHQQVQTKHFPHTFAWYVGSCHEGDKGFEFEMQRIAEEYDIAVISDSPSPRFAQSSCAIVFDDLTAAAYPQDFIDFSYDEVRVPAFLPEGELDDLRKRIQIARTKRNDIWTETHFTLEDGQTVAVSPMESEVGVIGTVWGKHQAHKGIALASALGVEVLINLTYSEGGNTLIGKQSDGTPYLIIGEDSFVASKIILEHELKREIEDKVVLMAFGVDYGIAIENIIRVEQPGDFHLDMNMMILGEETIAINDAVLATEEFAPYLDDWLREEHVDEMHHAEVLRYLAVKANMKKILEDITAENLRSHGFEVIRVGGCLERKREYRDQVQVMNFFNTLSATVMEDGEEKRIIIAMWANDYFKEKFESLVRSQGAEIDQIYCLRRTSSEESLEKHAGISCRTKTL